MQHVWPRRVPHSSSMDTCRRLNSFPPRRENPLHLIPERGGKRRKTGGRRWQAAGGSSPR
ncbi:hypothetical protein E2C01_074415 [Portunus trituberculatus]|uniref:Uncharacterized protein n=1 Tax=Portunus trituberculatus TaxID=210409 RepID=A0A5B7I7Z0_PORTR|nr:hypothetical protein [Portunus trituberculatus]